MENKDNEIPGSVNTQAPTTLMDKCGSVRSCMLSWEKMVLDLKECGELNLPPETPNQDIGEAKANIMLAYRHMEDARMRIGKVIQAMSGGKSIYDTKTLN